MPTQYPLIDAQVEPQSEIAPPQQDIFLVAAFRRGAGQGYWKIHSEHPTPQDAELHARQLSDGWSHRCIVRVRLGGTA